MARSWSNRAALISACVILAGAVTTAARGATFAVDSDLDQVDATPGDGTCQTAVGTCTLRAAVQEANALGGAHQVQLPAGTLVLDLAGFGEDFALSGDLDVRADVTLIGQGLGSTVIDAAGLGDRAFHVLPPARSVTLSGLTISGGYGRASGGGVFIEGGDVSLLECRVADNRTDFAGGGIAVAAGAGLELRDSMVENNFAPTLGGGGLWTEGTIAIHDSTFRGNDASFGGGGAISAISGQVLVDNTSFESNTAGWDGFGGAIHVGGSDVTVLGSTFQANEAREGGALFVEGGDTYIERTLLDANGLALAGVTIGGAMMVVGGEVSLVSSTISNCVAGMGGGIVANFDGRVRALNSTLSGNRALDRGGAIVVMPNLPGGRVELLNCTVTGNSAASAGGGVYTWADGVVSLGNTLLGDNALDDPGLPGQDCDTTEPLQSLGYNLISSTPGCQVAGDPTGNILDVAPNVLPLTDNGGDTPTHALAPTSPAVDAGDPAGCIDLASAALDEDQRGELRPQDGDNDAVDRCDIGAFELEPTCQPVEPSALDRDPGADPFLLARGPGDDITMTWQQASPRTYHVYRGSFPASATLGTRGAMPYDHREFGACRIANETAVIPAAAGSWYFLVVATCQATESSTGRDSNGLDRPPASPGCP